MISNHFADAHETIIRLCDTFKTHHVQYHQSNYNETAVRKDFLDKFFHALGWDVNHDEQTNPYEQEVKVEKNVQVAARVKKADYAFYIKPNFRDERFFVEAKKPSVALETPDNCFQTIRYAYSSSRAAVSILTNFKELLVMDCRFRPDINTAANHVHKKYSYEDFRDKDKFAEVYYLFGRESVADGSLEKYAETLPKPKGKVKQRKLFADGFRDLDDDFLAKLEEYRAELAKMFKRKNPHLTSEDLTEATQRTLDRLVFIRFLEDKLIEPSTILDKFGDKPHAWKQFVAKSRDFDKSYNGIIFKPHNIIDAETFNTDDKTFLDICDDFASKYSPYHFNYIPIHILGSIYERFLGNVITVTAKQAKVEPKPEVRKAGGVFYTPEYIVRYIVENTVGTLVEKRTPSEVAEMRFADIACGSGSFLLGVYDYLLRWHTRFYNLPRNKTQAKRDGCLANDDGTFHLSFEQKREILTNNIYGTDIDRQAFEVTQLSLYLKLLDEETQGSTQRFLGGFREALLPSLTDNIHCGNALVDWDVTGGDLFEQLDYEKERKLNPMSFAQKFPEVMKRGGFDAIVGNPPYGAQFDETVKKYLAKKYSIIKGQPESYEYFVLIALAESNDSGMFSYIIPTNFIESERAEGLRNTLLNSGHIKVLSNFRYNVWKDNASEPLVVIYKKANEIPQKNSTLVIHPNSPDEFSNNTNAEVFNQNDWLNTSKKRFLLRANANLIKKIEKAERDLNDICEVSQGIIVYKTREEGNKNLYISETQETNEWKRLLDTHSSLKPYQIIWGNRYLKYGSWLWCPREDKFFEEPKIVFIRLRNKSLTKKLIGAYDDNKFYNRDNFNNIILKDKNYSLKYILALFNSKLLNYWYKAYFDNVNINPAQVRLLPIKSINFKNNPTDKAKHDELVRMVEQIMAAKSKLNEARNDGEREFYANKCGVLEDAIDNIVFDLYDLTAAERDLVRGG